MNILGQVGIVFGICLLGELISAILPFTFPASIIGMLLLLLLLGTRTLKIEHIGAKADFLLQNMTFFFIPAGVGILEHVQLLRGRWWQLLVICFVTTILVFVASAGTVSAVLAFQRAKRRNRGSGGEEATP